MARWGANHGPYFAVESVSALLLISVVLAVLLYPATRAFARFKARRRDLAWLRYL